MTILNGKACLLAVLLASQTAFAADPCTKFTWDVTRELNVMRLPPQIVTIGLTPDSATPLELDKLYELKLAGQSTVNFAAKPAKPTLDDGAQAGLLRFKTTSAGRYRISITSGHWIDVVEGAKTIASRDFQGQRGCERPRKIVEYELPAGRELLLQLSGSTDANILLAVTTVSN